MLQGVGNEQDQSKNPVGGGAKKAYHFDGL
jgi:hypothetical protein